MGGEVSSARAALGNYFVLVTSRADLNSVDLIPPTHTYVNVQTTMSLAPLAHQNVRRNF
jgi:hypothetical protein